MAAEDERSKRKEQLLQVAQRVQSEYSFRYVASGSESQEDNLSGLSSTDEYVSLCYYLHCESSI